MELKNLKLIHTFGLQLTGEETHYVLIPVWPHDVSSYTQKFGCSFLAFLVIVFLGFGFGFVGVFLGGKIFFLFYKGISRMNSATFLKFFDPL